ncbi:MAG: DUF1553 domain-containing protein [Planctomycetes bacterium]|nr:DUF1553 domain-containing protein [Planctomycetota bacterium]
MMNSEPALRSLWLASLFLAFVSTAARAEDRALKLADYDKRIKPEDRQHWAYRPVRRPPVPRTRDRIWSRHPIDAFILANLERRGRRPARDVSRSVWLRRIFLDMIGVPPTLAEQRRFLRDRSPNAFETVIDDLLARPAYGERWGRHWLDLVRFAETNGYERDAIKPHAWRYRDYVIRSLNGDKPYNRFVLEQLAGDELPDRSSETVIATGYYRLGPWDDEPADPKQDRFDQLDDLVRTTSRVFLGMTLGCARCHDHKFDALTMHDYTRMIAVFEPLKRPLDGRRELDRPAGSREQLAAIVRRDKRIRNAESRIRTLENASQQKYLASNPKSFQPPVIAALRTAEKSRTAVQKELVKKHAQRFASAVIAARSERTMGEIGALRSSVARLRRTIPDLPRAYFLSEDSPQPPVTHLMLRGRASTPGPRVNPGVPAVLVISQPQFLKPDQHTTRRRLTLARWIVDSRNPLTARVIVNRVWQWHFGAGLVRTASDFGTLGTPPTHPQLLDWLAHWFVHEGQWSLKRLHRLILSSSTYRMSKRSQAKYAVADPENLSFWRFPYRRLEVEAIRDSMLSVSGRLNQKMRGPSTYLSVPPEALAGHSDPHKIWKPLNETEASRRTVYALIKRSFIVPMLEVLDLCDTTRSVGQRKVTTVPTQALTLLNGEFVNRQSRHFAARLWREAGSDPNRQIDLAFQLALCRPPQKDERKTVRQFLQHEAAGIRREKSVSEETARQQALVRLCRVIFNLNEFVYPD